MAEDGTDTPQSNLEYSGRDGWNYTPLSLARSTQVPEFAKERELDAWGLGRGWIGKQPFDILQFGEDVEFRRYQWDVIYTYRRGKGDDAEYFPVEFRCWINTIGEIPETWKRHIRMHDNPRLQYAFNSGPYGEGGRGGGYMRGFQFFSKDTNEEDDEIAADEATNLGIGQFEVLLHMDGDVQGHAGGFFDPFEMFAETPSEETWTVTRNDAREDYEFRPQGRARQRLRGKDKMVFLNGQYIGQTVPSRGTVYLSFDYSSQDNTWKNTQTGKQMWSRRKFINEGLFHSNAVRAGGQVYKVGEDSQAITLVATKPDGFDPTPESDIPGFGEDVFMDLSDSTSFDIRFDEGSMMGKYDTPTTRVVSTETDLMV